jgi:2-dehydropantoate 2-reductase
VVGSGALGCLWASYLAPTHRVHLVDARTRDSGRIVVNRRCLFEPPGPEARAIELERRHPAALSEPIQCALICTKSYHAVAAVSALAPFLAPGATLYLFQNGLGSQHALMQQFSALRLCAAVTTEGAYLDAPGRVVHAGRGVTQLGWLQACPEPCPMLPTTALTQQVVPDIHAVLWRKLAINCAINPFTALHRCRNGEVPDTPTFKALWPSLRSELHALLALHRVHVTVSEIDSMIHQVIRATAGNYSSMCQDAQRRRRTEIDDINGFAWRQLQQAELPHAANHQLWERVHALGH